GKQHGIRTAHVRVRVHETVIADRVDGAKKDPLILKAVQRNSHRMTARNDHRTVGAGDRIAAVHLDGVPGDRAKPGRLRSRGRVLASTDGGFKAGKHRHPAGKRGRGSGSDGIAGDKRSVEHERLARATAGEARGDILRYDHGDVKSKGRNGRTG